MYKYLLALVLSLLVAGTNAEREAFHVTLENHRFNPAKIQVPANTLAFFGD